MKLRIDMYPDTMAFKATATDDIRHDPDLAVGVFCIDLPKTDKGVGTNIDEKVYRKIGGCAPRSIIITILECSISELRKELGDTVVSTDQIEDTNADEPREVRHLQIDPVGEMIKLEAKLWGSRSQILNAVTAIVYYIQGKIPFSDIASNRPMEPYPRVDMKRTRID